MFKVAAAKLCYNRSGDFVSLYVSDSAPSGSVYEIKEVGKGKTKVQEFWIEARSKESTTLMAFIYPGWEDWDAFKPFWGQFLSESDIEMLEKLESK